MVDEKDQKMVQNLVSMTVYKMAHKTVGMKEQPMAHMLVWTKVCKLVLQTVLKLVYPKADKKERKVGYLVSLKVDKKVQQMA